MKTTALAAFLLLALVSCRVQREKREPEEVAAPIETSEPADLHDQRPPPTDEPNANGGAGDAPLCWAISPYCDYTVIWPLTGTPADPSRCYCLCSTHEECANIPGANECGTPFQSDGDGGVEWVFGVDTITVCRKNGTIFAP